MSIGDGSYIGINAVIVDNVKIGKHCVIGANSVFTEDVPDYCVAINIEVSALSRKDIARINIKNAAKRII